MIADNRTYHFQAEDEADQRAWMSVLVNCKERALLRAFDASGKAEAGTGNPSLVELQQAVIRCVMRLPGNDQCCDCSSQNGKFEIMFRILNISTVEYVFPLYFLFIPIYLLLCAISTTVECRNKCPKNTKI